MIRMKTLALAPLALALACGGGGSGARGTSATGSLTLILGADSQREWGQMVVGIEKVEVSADGSTWAALATPKTTVDLMALQNGFERVLVSQASLPTGTYSVRVTWATVNYAVPINAAAYVVPTGGTIADGSVLTMPAATTVQGTITVGSGGDTQGLLMLDGAHAVQVYPKGGSTEAVFQPHPELIAASTSGDIWGQVTAGGLAGAGQEVMAEIVTGNLTPVVRRRAITDANGAFLLRALPVSQAGVTFQYFLVCMPSGTTAGTAFPAMGLGPIAPVAGGSVKGQNFVFTPGTALSTGSLGLTFTPPSAKGTSTSADLRQTLTIGSVSPALIVREGVVVTGSASDTRLFTGLPVGLYGANGTRVSTSTATVAAPGQSAVTAGGTATVSLAFP